MDSRHDPGTKRRISAKIPIGSFELLTYSTRYLRLAVRKSTSKSPPDLALRRKSPTVAEMWFKIIAILTVVFCFAMFSVVLILHSFVFDPDTEDVPEHLRALKTLAWFGTVLCIYYNAGEIEGSFQRYLESVIFFLAGVLLIGLWYIWRLPKWHRQTSEDQVREWGRDPDPEENTTPNTTEREYARQSNQDSEARRQQWKLQQRDRFSQDPATPQDQVDLQDQADSRDSVVSSDPVVPRDPVDVVESLDMTIGTGDVESQSENNLASRSGYPAYSHVEDAKTSERLRGVLTFREVLWWVEGKRLECVSEFTDRAQWSKIPRVAGDKPLTKNPSALFLTVISVEQSSQIRPALKLIRTTLDQITYYNKFYNEQSRTQFQNSVAVGCQLKKYPADPRKTDDEDNHLVSCLSICVDKILVVNFHIIHMITEVKDTCEATDVILEIARLFREFILEKKYIKIWFNYQKDIKAMEATLDEIFRGTPRPAFKMNAFPGWLQWPNPSYKLDLNPAQASAFNQKRPERLTFRTRHGSRWGTECPYGFHINSVDVFGHPCPCRTGNLDFAVVTEFIIRDIHIEDPRAILQKRPWTEIRYRGSYGHFVTCMLLGDRYEELFKLLRNTDMDMAHPPPTYPSSCLETCHYFECERGCGNRQLKAEYSSLVTQFKESYSKKFDTPSFQAVPQLLGNAIGSVVSLALVARFVMTTENPRLLAERLRFWSFLPATGPRPVPEFARPIPDLRKFVSYYPQWSNSSGLIKYVSLFLDNKPFEDENLIGWDISGDQGVRKLIAGSSRWKLITDDKSVLCNIAWRFMKSHPALFGDFIFSYSMRQYSPVLRTLDGNNVPIDKKQLNERSVFGKETIKIIFQQKSFKSIYVALLPIVIAQLEITLLTELERDSENVVQMADRFDECRRKCGPVLNEADRKRLLDAKKVLSKKYKSPVWKPTAVTPVIMYPVSRWIFKPFQEFPVFPNRYGLGTKLLEGLVNEFLALRSADTERRNQTENILAGLTGGQGPTLLGATTQGLRFFSISEFEWMWRDGQGEIKNQIEKFIGFWVSLFFETTIPKVVDSTTGEQYLTFNDDEDTVNGTRFAEKIYELTFSPTNFYMPEFGSVKPEDGVADLMPTLPKFKGEERVTLSARPDGSELVTDRIKDEGEDVRGGWGGEDIQGGWDVGSGIETGRNWWNVEEPDVQYRATEGTATPTARRSNPSSPSQRDKQFRHFFNLWVETILGPSNERDVFPERDPRPSEQEGLMKSLVDASRLRRRVAFSGYLEATTES